MKEKESKMTSKLERGKSHIHTYEAEHLVCKYRCVHCDCLIAVNFADGDAHEQLKQCAWCGMWQVITSEVKYYARKKEEKADE